MTVRVFHGFAESMRHLADDVVALTVTSPPYWNAIDYDIYAKDPSENWKTRRYAKGFTTYHEFLALMRRCFAEVQRATRPGGFCAVVVGTILHEGKMIPLPFDLAQVMLDIGWIFHQDIVWEKNWSSSKRGGTLIKHPWPGNFYPNTLSEYILVFRKAGESELRKNRTDAARILIDTLYAKEISSNVWHITPVRPKQIAHPCPYPEEIVHRLVTLFSRAGDLVLDPFAGSGQTLKVANALGRRVIGYDIEPAFVDLANKRASETYIRGPQLIVSYDKLEPGIPIGNSKRSAA